VDASNKLVLIWSAKAGCTFAIKWLLDHMGLLEEAIAYDRWVHRYRVEKLYASEAHEAAVENFLVSPASYRVVKLVRQPFKRVVSSYAHAATCGYEDARISAFLGRAVDGTCRFSFREFVHYLESINLRRGNIHHRLQTHPLERIYIAAPSFLVDLDRSLQSFSRLEVFLGLPRTELRRYLNSHHHVQPAPASAGAFSGDIAFDILHKSHRELPVYRSFYDQDLEDRVYRLYAEDFLRYGFSTSLKDASP
jgi:hypothetical protein